MIRRAALLSVVLAACGAGSDTKPPDAMPGSDAMEIVDAPPDDGAIATGGVLLVAQSPAEPANADPATWAGMRAFEIDADNAAPTEITGIPGLSLKDPVSTTYRAVSQEVLIGERHGTGSVDGVAGSIARFAYNPTAHAFTASGRITGTNIGSAIFQITLHPQTGELFACNVSTGISRFTFTGNDATANGTIANGPCRGVIVSPDSKVLFMTTAGTTIRRFTLATGTELPAVNVTGPANLHFMAVRAGQLYVGAIDANAVMRFQINADDSLSQLPSIPGPPTTVAMAFSPSGLEMFVSGVNVVARYRYNSATDGWDRATDITGAGPAAGLVMLPNH
ncbi:MAG TPA: hypothetical protein VGM90_33755 [Kofleriaceae bacterium]|jgi:hypothetical protein